MILMNTWGDQRSGYKGEGKICTWQNLKLVLNLGITHFQIDDGWQKGRSSNSALKRRFSGITIWRSSGLLGTGHGKISIRT